MQLLKTIMLLFIGGGIGANLRYWFSGFVSERSTSLFPWGTMLVNISGSLAIGVIMGIIIYTDVSSDWRKFFVFGLLGGYTTFSTFSYETFNLLQEKSYLLAFVNIFMSVGLCLFAVYVGLIISRSFVGG